MPNFAQLWFDLCLIWVSDTSQPEEGACHPATLGPGLVFRPEAAILGGARWSQVGVNELPLFCHPFEWTGQNLTQIFKVYQQSATQFEKIFHLKIKSCIECEMVEFLPLIRNDESNSMFGRFQFA